MNLPVPGGRRPKGVRRRAVLEAPWLIARLHRVHRAPAVGVVLLLLIALVALDYRIGADISLATFYLLPAGLAMWVLGRAAGLAVAVTSALCWTVVQQVAPNAGVPLAAVWDLASHVLMFLLAAIGLSAFRAAYVHERRLARVDEVTGLPNRHAFVARAELELVRAQRLGRPLTMAFLDMDDFKLLNDRLGHAAGDGALAAIGLELAGAVRAVDLVARIGGDEFAVLLPELDGPGAAAAVGRIHAALSLSCSAGCVTWITPPTQTNELFRASDRLMYEVKRERKGKLWTRVIDGATAPVASAS